MSSSSDIVRRMTTVLQMTYSPPPQTHKHAYSNELQLFVFLIDLRVCLTLPGVFQLGIAPGATRFKAHFRKNCLYPYRRTQNSENSI